MGSTPPAWLPGIGLRPGGERPDLEPFVVTAFAALYESVAAHARLGLNVVVDVGHHDGYSRPLGILRASAGRLRGLPAWLVGVRCPIETVLARRAASGFLSGSEDEPVPEPVGRWQEAVHRPGIYDIEVDTAALDPSAAAEVVRQELESGRPPTAFARILARPDGAGRDVRAGRS
jgi:chloramphenicol 3-O phosphotransferase